MTVTETQGPSSPSSGAGTTGRAEPNAATPVGARTGGWLDTADHKRVGLLFVFASLAFLLIGGVAGVLLRAELAEPGVQLLENQYGRAFTLHASVLLLLFVPGMWAGLASFVVPLQIGANRVAFPRLLALGFWLYAAGGGLLLATYGMDGLGLPAALFSGGASVGARATTSENLWMSAVALVHVAALMVAIVLVVTVARLRPPGMTFARVPLFAWSVLVSGTLAIVALPAALAGLLLLYIDQHFGGVVFASPAGSDIWQRTLWVFGRPDVYLLVLPGLGAACDIVTTHARRPLLSATAARWALAAFGALSLGAWAAGRGATSALTVPTFTAFTGLVALPLVVLVLVWLGTAVKGRPRLHVSVVLVLAAVLAFGLAALNAAIAGVVGVHGAAWTTGYLHAALFGPALLLVGAALYHWAPKLFGRQLGAAMGMVTALLLLGGSVIQSGGSFLLGYAGAPNHVDDVVGKSSWTGFGRLAAFGGILLALGVVALVAEVVRASGAGPDAAVGADPYGGTTLEWATASPPPSRNFDALPAIASADPLAPVAPAGAAAGGEG